MGCPRCDLLAKYGFGDRICISCAEKIRGVSAKMGEAFRNERDKMVAQLFTDKRQT